MQRRGIHVDFLFCNLAGDEHERTVVAVAQALSEEWSFGSPPKLYVADFQAVARNIVEEVAGRYNQVVLKRQFYRPRRAACGETRLHGALHRRSPRPGFLSDPSEPAHHRGCCLRLPILRPLLTYEKEEVLNLCRSIGGS